MYLVEYEFLAPKFEPGQLENLVEESKKYSENTGLDFHLAFKEIAGEKEFPVVKYHDTVKCKSKRDKIVQRKLMVKHPNIVWALTANHKRIFTRI